MTPYVPPGRLPFSTVLARLAEAWMPEAWDAAPARETAVLLGEEVHDFQRRSALRPGTLPDAIYTRLRPMLADGRLPTLLHVQIGQPRIIPPASWQGEAAGDLRALLDGRVGFALDGGIVEHGGVLVSEDALAAVLERRAVPMPVAATAEPVQRPEPKRNLGGKPPRHDLARFLGIVAHVQYDRDPGTPAELRRLALDTYAASLPAGAEPPTDEWAKPHVRAFLAGFEMGGRRSN